MKRRTWIKRTTLGVAVLGFCSLPFAVARLLTPTISREPHTHIPLPGALEDHPAFVQACIGCGLCGEVCPPRCIEFYKHEGGFAANTPYINPEKKACILCGLCMEVCPTEALTVTAIREIKMGIAQIDRSACYPWVDKGICGACVSICPLGESAINFDFGNIYRPVVQSGCVGCGLCIEVCPEPSLPIKIVDASLGMVAEHQI